MKLRLIKIIAETAVFQRILIEKVLYASQHTFQKWPLQSFENLPMIA